MAIRAKFARLARYLREFVEASHIYFKNSQSMCRQVWQVRATRLGESGESVQHGLANVGESGESAQNGLANVGESGEYSQNGLANVASLASLAYF